MIYNVVLNFEDGVICVIQCDDDEKVIDVVFCQKINLLMDCCDGVCGICKCFVEKGEYELEFYMDELMSDEEVEEGYVFICQMILESDCVVWVLVLFVICKIVFEVVEVEVQGVDKFFEIFFGLWVNLVKLINFLLGQYVNLIVFGMDKYWFYFFLFVLGVQEVIFLICNLFGGVMSIYFGEQVKFGDVLIVIGLMGVFYLWLIECMQVWFVGGIGLVLFFFMLE